MRRLAGRRSSSLGFYYWATAGYMARQTDETIAAEIAGLAEQYRQRGIEGLSVAIASRMTRNPRGSAIYLLADPKYQRIVGNLDRWPPSALDAKTDVTNEGWLDFTIYEEESVRGDSYRACAALRPAGRLSSPGRPRRAGARAAAGADHRGAAPGAWRSPAALAFAGGALMSRSTIGRIDAVNRTSREIMKGDLTRRVPTARHGRRVRPARRKSQFDARPHRDADARHPPGLRQHRARSAQPADAAAQPARKWRAWAISTRARALIERRSRRPDTALHLQRAAVSPRSRPGAAVRASAMSISAP